MSRGRLLLKGLKAVNDRIASEVAKGEREHARSMHPKTLVFFVVAATGAIVAGLGAELSVDFLTGLGSAIAVVGAIGLFGLYAYSMLNNVVRSPAERDQDVFQKAAIKSVDHLLDLFESMTLEELARVDPSQVAGHLQELPFHTLSVLPRDRALVRLNSNGAKVVLTTWVSLNGPDECRVTVSLYHRSTLQSATKRAVAGFAKRRQGETRTLDNQEVLQQLSAS